MEERFRMQEVDPAAFNALMAIEKYLAGTSIDPLHKELIKIRASQINGCAFCIDKHTKDARRMGETEQRLYLLPVWREAPHFSHEERIILSMTEEITLISEKGLTNVTYVRAIAQFGLEHTAQLIMAITAINMWNRIGVSSHRIPPIEQ
ncbi:MAG TPA: carboxymuconolactone decarboxylase family protein [Chitinophaga sp.]|uniref:carboxymuconolactone decarboxylase family protein n=1 Tax=Chitinophaga sp. TaxID=1869181 RepID=UPI002C7E4A07|nr:carboxymuconolactone decarboxylase family protein [Chitinophaga sp.]HVI47770.1 carboxymuconolactone decarboxylase family protein [Chitinophaga sp.]